MTDTQDEERGLEMQRDAVSSLNSISSAFESVNSPSITDIDKKDSFKYFHVLSFHPKMPENNLFIRDDPNFENLRIRYRKEYEAITENVLSSSKNTEEAIKQSIPTLTFITSILQDSDNQIGVFRDRMEWFWTKLDEYVSSLSLEKLHLTPLMHKDAFVEHTTNILAVFASLKGAEPLKELEHALRAAREDLIKTSNHSLHFLNEISFSRVFETRNSIFYFLPILSHYDIIHDTTLTADISAVLYHLDQLLSHYAGLPTGKTTSFDVSFSADSLADILQSILVLPSSEYLSLDVLNSIGVLEPIIMDISDSFNCTKADIDVVKSIVNAIEGIQGHLENVARCLICAKHYKSASTFSIEFTKFYTVCKLLIDSNQNNSDKMFTINTDFIKQQIDLNKDYPNFEYDNMTIEQFVLNPEETAAVASLSHKVKEMQSWSDKQLTKYVKERYTVLKSVDASLQNLTPNFQTPKIIALTYKKLMTLGVVIDILRSRQGIDTAEQFRTLYFSSIESLNEAIKNYQQFLLSYYPTPTNQKFANSIPLTISYINPAFGSIISLDRTKRPIVKTVMRQVRALQKLTDKLVENYSESKLVVYVQQLKPIIDFLTEMTDNLTSQELDKVARESNLSHHINNIIEVTSVLIYTVESFSPGPHDVPSVISNLRMFVKDATNYINRMILSSTSHITSLFVMFIRSIVSTVSEAIDQLSRNASVKPYANVISDLFNRFESLPDLLSLGGILYDVSISQELSLSRWMLTHLESDYVMDEEIRDLLHVIVKELEVIESKTEGNALNPRFTELKEYYQRVTDFFSDFTERLGDEFIKYSNEFKDSIEAITRLMNQPDPLKIRDNENKVRHTLADLIKLMTNEVISLPDVSNPIDEFEGTILYEFCLHYASHFGVPSELPSACQNALKSHNLDENVKQFNILVDTFINTDEIDLLSFKQQIALFAPYAIVSFSKLDESKKMTSIIRSVVEANEDEMTVLFDLSFLLKHDRTSDDVYWLAGQIIKELADSHRRLSEICYLMELFTKVNDNELYTEFLREAKKCVHQSEDLINTREIVISLRRIILTKLSESIVFSDITNEVSDSVYFSLLEASHKTDQRILKLLSKTPVVDVQWAEEALMLSDPLLCIALLEMTGKNIPSLVSYVVSRIPVLADYDATPYQKICQNNVELVPISIDGRVLDFADELIEENDEKVLSVMDKIADTLGSDGLSASLKDLLRRLRAQITVVPDLNTRAGCIEYDKSLSDVMLRLSHLPIILSLFNMESLGSQCLKALLSMRVNLMKSHALSVFDEDHIKSLIKKSIQNSAESEIREELELICEVTEFLKRSEGRRYETSRFLRDVIVTHSSEKFDIECLEELSDYLVYC